MLKRILLCTAAFAFAAGVGFTAPQAASTAKSWSGYVTDSKCATNAKARTDAACVKKCIDAGDKYVLYDTANKKVYQLEPQSEVAEHATHHVRISGTLDGDTITVTSVKMLSQPKAKAAPAAGS
ncbi:MAG TPA: hypothetical protein VGU63_00705 [Candidatus Acidoferrales bacterium]|nr:hypothetical protein [Candidatus Acidoferrales bacterium]